MRGEPSILHVDLDAMFAAVEQRDKVSLRGKPVIVGGVAGRGVVSTASYEARAFGAHSAMPMAQARRRCPPGTAYLSPRFAAYKRTSSVVMALLAEVTPLVEQVSIDEAYLDLAAADHDLSPRGVTELAMSLKREIAAATGGITGSVGVASSKLLAKIGSELHKPDGLTVVPAGSELEVLHPLPVGRLGGVGPATEQRLHRAGVRTVGQLARVPLEDLVDWFGTAHGGGLYRLARADDDRPVVGEREAKSVSAEETFDVDLTDTARLNRELDLLAARVAGRLRSAGITGRTVNIKVRHHDFTTVTRAITRDQPTDDPRLVAQLARRLLSEIDTSAGIRLLGVGVSTLADFAQDDLFSSFPGGTWSAVPVSPPPAGEVEIDHPFTRESSIPVDLSSGMAASVVAAVDVVGQSVDGPAGAGLRPALAVADAAEPPVGVRPGPGADDAAGRPARVPGVSGERSVPAVPDVGGGSAERTEQAVAHGAAERPELVADPSGGLAGAGERPAQVAVGGSAGAGERPAQVVADLGGGLAGATEQPARAVAGPGAPAINSAGPRVEAAAGPGGWPGQASAEVAGQVAAFPIWRPGQDVWHEEHGAGWVWGSGLGRVTVRFEGPRTPPGPVRTFAADDPLLRPADPPDWRE